MANVIGRRIYPDAEGYLALEPGDYGKDLTGKWWCMPPRGVNGPAAGGCLVNHTVTEHEDGTITVSPSILLPGACTYHGFLEHGQWREC